jgi:ATP-dependent DNA helicase RecG
LQLIKNNKLTYGGLLFLGKATEIQEHFPDFRIDYLEIPATSYADAEPRYTFRVQEQENLWEYYFVLFQRLQIYADNPLAIGNMGIGYEDTKQLSALREALVNLLIHSDYFSPMKPRIRAFTNRIEFENPGALPRSINELMREEISVPRNPVLAKLFRTAKLCESAGYGFDKMLVWKKETGMDVIFDSAIDKTKVTFMLRTDLKTDLKTDPKTDPKIDEIDIEIINRINHDQYITISEISKAIGRGGSATKARIAKMQKSGYIQRVKKPKSSYWRLVKTDLKTDLKTDPKTDLKIDEIDMKIINQIDQNRHITISEISKAIGKGDSAIKERIAKMQKEGYIKRTGGTKGGYWERLKPI